MPAGECSRAEFHLCVDGLPAVTLLRPLRARGRGERRRCVTCVGSFSQPSPSVSCSVPSPPTVGHDRVSRLSVCGAGFHARSPRVQRWHGSAAQPCVRELFTCTPLRNTTRYKKNTKGMGRPASGKPAFVGVSCRVESCKKQGSRASAILKQKRERKRSKRREFQGIVALWNCGFLYIGFYLMMHNRPT